ncbi:DUF1949 domain-containing protein, partial [bacterium]|nr:DUF1949 domain-containing protein [bacterium]
TFELAFGYELIGPLEHLLGKHAGHVLDSAFSEDVTWTIWLPEDRWRSFARELGGLAHGRIKLRAPG